MANKTLSIKLEATDAISGPLKKIADSATQTGNALENAGRDAESGFDKVEEGARAAEVAVEKVDDASRKAGLGLQEAGAAATAFGTALLYSSQQAMTEERQIVALRRAYGEFGDEMLALAERMDQDLRLFSDDDIRAGEQYFATLYNQLGFSISEIETLMLRTADLAATYGMSFEDASQRITAAARGETESSEALGLSLQQQQIDRENLTLSMSAEEAAHFRMNAMMQQSVMYQGAAAEISEKSAGAYGELKDQVSDAAAAVGQFIGPLPALVSGLGMTSLGLTTLVGTTQKTITTLRSSSLAMKALSVATSPVAIGLGAVAAGAYILWDSFEAGERRAQTLKTALEELNLVQEQLLISGENSRAGDVQSIEDYIGHVQDAAEARRKMFLEGDDDYRWMMVEKLGVESLGEAYRFFNDSMTLTDQEMQRLTVQMSRLSTYMADAQIDSAGLSEEVEKLWMRFMTDETYGLDQFLADLEAIDVTAHRLIGTLRGLGDALGVVTSETAALVLQSAQFAPHLTRINSAVASMASGLGLAVPEINDTSEALARLEVALDRTFMPVGEIVLGTAGAFNEAANAAEQAEEHISGFGTGIGEGFRATVDSVGADVEELRQWVLDTATSMLELTNNASYLSQVNLTGLATDATDMAEGFTDVATALDSVLAIYGQIDSMGQRFGQSVSIAEALVGEPGAWAAIDDLFASGRISIEQYNAAVESGYAIMERQAGVEESLNVIRANQLPLLEQTSAAYADYIDQVAAMNAQEQAVAVGWLNTGMQDRVQQFADLGNELRRLGPAGAEAMQQVVDGIVATDPVLTAMLDDLGLIKRELDGSYTINMDAVGAMDSTERLIASINALTLALGGVPPLDIEVTGLDDVEAAEQSVQNLITSATQDAVISITTRLAGPTTGDGTAGPVYDGEPIPIPATPVFGDGTAGPVYEGPAVPVPTDLEAPEQPPAEWLTPDPVEIPTELLPPDIPVTFWEPEPVRIPVELDFSSLGAGVSGAAGDALAAAQSISIPAPDTSEALAAVQEVQEAITGLDGASATITITGDYASAQEAVEYARSMHGGDWWGNYTVYGDYSSATEAVEYTRAVHGADWWGNYTVYGDYSSVVDAVEYARQFHGAAWSGTYTLTAVTVGDIGPGTGGRGGGIVGNLSRFAGGGMVEFIGGEAGPELAHFVGGGLASLPVHGIYSAPAGTYISPAHTTASTQHSGGGDVSIQVTVQGDVYGIDDLTERVMREMTPVLEAAARQQRRSMGGLR